MIRVYFLPVETIDGTEQVAGIGQIHDALLDTTEQPDIRKLTQDTDMAEHAILSYLATDWNDADQDEIDHFNAQVIPFVPDPDTIRAQELLTASPPVISMVEMWELMRIFGRRLGYDF